MLRFPLRTEHHSETKPLVLVTSNLVQTKPFIKKPMLQFSSLHINFIQPINTIFILVLPQLDFYLDDRIHCEHMYGYMREFAKAELEHPLGAAAKIKYTNQVKEYTLKLHLCKMEMTNTNSIEILAFIF